MANRDRIVIALVGPRAEQGVKPLGKLLHKGLWLSQFEIRVPQLNHGDRDAMFKQILAAQEKGNTVAAPELCAIESLAMTALMDDGIDVAIAIDYDMSHLINRRSNYGARALLIEPIGPRDWNPPFRDYMSCASEYSEVFHSTGTEMPEERMRAIVMRGVFLNWVHESWYMQGVLRRANIDLRK